MRKHYCIREGSNWAFKTFLGSSNDYCHVQNHLPLKLHKRIDHLNNNNNNIW